MLIPQDWWVYVLALIAATDADNVTWDKAHEIGNRIMCRRQNIQYKDIKLPRSETVRTLANMHNTYKLDDGHTEIDANILFYWLLVAQQQADIAHSFAYELTPYPAAAALFNDGFMRKPVKS